MKFSAASSRSGPCNCESSARPGRWGNGSARGRAFKSRQFTVSFLLLLLLGWMWSICGLAIMGPAASYSTGGPFMFFGYYLILAFPLIVIVPYSAFRSLATEREDRTYELLSITK